MWYLNSAQALFPKSKEPKGSFSQYTMATSIDIITKGYCTCHGQQIILRLIFLGRGLWPLTRTADSGTTTRRQTGSVPKPSSSFSLALQLITRLQRKTAITNKRSWMVVSYVLPEKKEDLKGKWSCGPTGFYPSSVACDLCASGVEIHLRWAPARAREGPNDTSASCRMI